MSLLKTNNQCSVISHLMWYCSKAQLWLVRCSAWEFITVLMCCVYSVYEKFPYEWVPCGPPAWVITNIHKVEVFYSVDVSQYFEVYLCLLAWVESYFVPVVKAQRLLICVGSVFNVNWQTFCTLMLCSRTTTKLICPHQWLHLHTIQYSKINRNLAIF